MLNSQNFQAFEIFRNFRSLGIFMRFYEFLLIIGIFWYWNLRKISEKSSMNRPRTTLDYETFLFK
jgi:hypothetical protein